MHQKMIERGLSVDDLRRLFSYNHQTGLLRWKSRPVSDFLKSKDPELRCAIWNDKFSGSEAGGNGKNGYKVVFINRKMFAVHRIAYAIYHGEWPKMTIDHIDRNPSNNKISNLRDVDQKENNKNRVFSKSGNAEKSKAVYLLRDYIKATGIKKQHFAKLVGVRNDHLSRWLAGKVKPERPARMLIALVTDGAVPTEDWE